MNSELRHAQSVESLHRKPDLKGLKGLERKIRLVSAARIKPETIAHRVDRIQTHRKQIDELFEVHEATESVVKDHAAEFPIEAEVTSTFLKAKTDYEDLREELKWEESSVEEAIKNLRKAQHELDTARDSKEKKECEIYLAECEDEYASLLMDIETSKKHVEQARLEYLTQKRLLKHVKKENGFLGRIRQFFFPRRMETLPPSVQKQETIEEEEKPFEKAA